MNDQQIIADNQRRVVNYLNTHIFLDLGIGMGKWVKIAELIKKDLDIELLGYDTYKDSLDLNPNEVQTVFGNSQCNSIYYPLSAANALHKIITERDEKNFK